MTTTTLERPVGYAHPTVPWNGLTVTDLFCGAGGSSSGLVEAGYRVVIAANHWQIAIDSHQLNHPDTDHDSADISQAEPSRFPTTDILWASPECTNHSVAKGIKRQRDAQAQLPGLEEKLPDEAAIRSRATMWDVPRFAEYHMYRAIIIENVVDAYRWVQFPAWLMAMELLGYKHEIVWLNSMHAQAHGLPAPQSRDRMYIVFWRKDRKTKAGGRIAPNIQKWTRPEAYCADHGLVRAVQAFKKKEPWGRYRAQYLYRCPKCAVPVEPGWLPALVAIDQSIPGERIGDRKKPLSPKTRRRAEGGIDKYWRPIIMEAAGNTYDSADPKHPQYGQDGAYRRAWPADEPFRTLHTSESKALAYPPIITDGIHGEGTVQSAAEALLTQTTAQTKGVVLPPLLVPVEGREGKEPASALDPMRTQTTRNETAIIVPLRQNNTAKSIVEPLDTVAANGNHHALLMRHNSSRGTGAEMMTSVMEPMRTLTTKGHQSLLVPYYGNGTAAPSDEPHRTLTTTDHYALLEAQGMSLDLDDCYFRMLTPDEIKVGMAFARDYILLGNKRVQVKQAGNAVTPPVARDLGCAVAEFLNDEEWELAA